MSLVVNASGDYIRRTANLPASNSYTVAMWHKRVAHIEDNQSILSVEATDVYHFLMTQSTDLWRLTALGGGTDISGVGPALDTWYYVALSNAGTGSTDLKAWIWDSAGTLIDALQATGTSFTVTGVRVLTNQYSQHSNGKVAYGRLWDAVLSQSELEAELASASIVRTANISTAFGADSATDVSGNGRNWDTNGIDVDAADNPTFEEAPVPDLRNVPGRRIYVLP